MARITRKNQKVFAGGASNNGQFGSAQLGTKVTSSDPDVIQALVAWVQGWNSATISSQRLPTLEEIQGIQYVITTQLSYLFQEGIAEYSAETTYYQNSIVRETGTYNLYGSITDDNVGNALSVDTEWEFLIDLASVQGLNLWAGNAAGTANAIELTPTPSVASYTAGMFYQFLATADSTSGTMTLDISAVAAESIKKFIGAGKVNPAVGDVKTGEIVSVVFDGTDFILISPRTYAKSADIATATTVVLNNATGDYVTLTGTTTVTAFTLAEGQEKTCRASGVFILAASANIILPTGVDITTAADDTFVVRGEASGVARVVNYQRADGTALAADVPIFSNEYDSGQQLYAISSAYTLAHGLGAKPKNLTFCLECVTIDLAYAVGDRVYLQDGGNSNTGGFTASADATYVTVATSSSATIFVVKGGTTKSNITTTRWRFRIIAQV